MAGHGPRSPYIWTCCVIVQQDVFPLVRNSKWSHPVREGVAFPVLVAADRRRWLSLYWLMEPRIFEMVPAIMAPRLRRSLRQPNLFPSSVGKE